MRTPAVLRLISTSVLCLSIPAAAAPRAPDWAALQLDRGRFRLEFRWDAPPQFPSGTTVEIEVHVDPKCFAKPPGGRDDDSWFRGANNLTRNGLRIYKDVWNYWQPTKKELAELIDERCGLNPIQEKGIEWVDPQFADQQEANFAIGIRNADRLVAGVPYYFEYDLDSNVSADANCRYGYATVRMQYFEEECMLPFGFGISDCPYLIGFHGCWWWIPTTPFTTAAFTRGIQIWQARVCGPTGRVEFRPSWNQDTDLIQRFGTVCVDKDQDDLCAVQFRDGNVMVPMLMFGTRVGDCNDSTGLIRKENYSETDGACACGVDPLCGVGAASGGAPPSSSLTGGTRGIGSGGSPPGTGGKISASGGAPSTASAGGRSSGGSAVETGGSTEMHGPVCGNGILETGEQCDGAALGGMSCENLVAGSSGRLTCSIDCVFSTSACTTVPDVCDGQDVPTNGVIDDTESCWRAVYRFWDESRPINARPRCYANSATAPVECAGYTREYNEATGIVYGPVFFLYDVRVAGTVALIAFDNAQDHILTREDQFDDLVTLRDLHYGYTERPPIGYIWSPTNSTLPTGTYYTPKEAATSFIRELRRYALVSAGIHLYANNPEETAPGWQSDGITGYVWGSRW